MKSSRLFVLWICLMLITACVHFPSMVVGESTLQVTENSPEVPTETATSVTVDDTPITETEPFSQVDFGKNARSYLEVLAGEIGSRLADTDSAISAAKYIQERFEEFGYTPETQQFTAYHNDEGTSFKSSNIIAIKQGLSDQQIVVGAHYDSVNDDGSRGADDNASGVAVMLETAKRVIKNKTPYTIVFVAFGAEEEGLWGSANYVDQLNYSSKKKIIGMVNLDSLIAGDKVYVYGNEGPGSMRDWMLLDAKQKGLTVEGKRDEDLFNEDGTPCECSDFDAFEKSHIPYAYFEATDWDLSPDGMTQVDLQYGDAGEVRHSGYDTIDYIDKTFPGRIDHHLNVFTTLLYDLVTQY